MQNLDKTEYYFTICNICDWKLNASKLEVDDTPTKSLLGFLMNSFWYQIHPYFLQVSHWDKQVLFRASFLALSVFF